VLTESELRWLCGVSVAEFAELVAQVGPKWEAARTARLSDRERARALGAGRNYELVFAARMFLTLVHLRHNLAFRGLGALVGMSKDTAHRAVREVVPLLADLGVTTSDGDTISSLQDLERFFAERDLSGVILDGTFIATPRPGASWEAQKAQYSGHRKCHCRTVQVLSDEQGNVLYVSDISDGPTHDLTAARASGIGEAAARSGTALFADRGYQGWGDKPDDPTWGPGTDDPEHDRLLWLPLPGGSREPGSYNHTHAQARVRVEHSIRSLKRFTVFHKYRSAASTIADTLRAVAAIVTIQPVTQPTFTG
jgi:hypothetical protein